MSEPLVDRWVDTLMLSEDEVPAFKSWWESSRGLYTGTVARQSLIDFCQEQVKILTGQANILWVSSESNKIDANMKRELVEGYSNCIAEINAYRKVTEWARDQVERSHGEQS